MEKESFSSLCLLSLLLLFFVSLRKMYLLMMTRRDHQKNITWATKRSGSPDKVLWVIVRTTCVSSCAHKIWQSRPQKIKS